ncbi:MAG TPA: FAD-binding oxidoreductase [Candidatus Dormibacteraeota bacterium]
MVTAASSAAQRFADAFPGDAVTPGDERFETVRRVWNGAIDRRPAVIARCTTVDHVVAAVGLARETGLRIAVRGGGHSVPGLCTCDAGVMVDLSPMRQVDVDPGQRLAHVEPGATWHDFDAATHAHGLASTGGLISSTGVAGLTLGGGIGWLQRKHGLACDNLVAAQVVTAEGEVVLASSEQAPELLWGLRGGGGNFGIVTSFAFRLHPVREVYGGMVMFPIGDGARVLRRYRTWAAEQPDDLTTLAGIMTAPPAPFVPQSLQGQKVVAVIGCHSGDQADAERRLAAIRELNPALDLFGPMPYPALQSMADAGAPPALRNHFKAGYTAELTDGLLDVVLEHGARLPSPMSQIHLHQMGGAVSRVGEDDTAFSNRRAAYAFNLIATWTDPADDDTHIAGNRALAAALEPYSSGGVYVNFLGDEGAARVRDAYGDAKYARLVRLKRAYDPQNMFSLNQNIVPATDAV